MGEVGGKAARGRIYKGSASRALAVSQPDWLHGKHLPGTTTMIKLTQSAVVVRAASLSRIAYDNLLPDSPPAGRAWRIGASAVSLLVRKNGDGHLGVPALVRMRAQHIRPVTAACPV